MFSLIITVISIALVAALAVASVYYGGPALSKGTSRAAAATVVSQGQQISGAATMQSSDSAVDVDDLTSGSNLITGKYLTSIPTPPASVGTAWDLGAALTNDAGFLTIGTTSADICLEVEKNRDSSTVANDMKTVANGGNAGRLSTGTVDDSNSATLVSGQFGCIGNVTADAFKVYYSL